MISINNKAKIVLEKIEKEPLFNLSPSGILSYENISKTLSSAIEENKCDFEKLGVHECPNKWLDCEDFCNGTKKRELNRCGKCWEKALEEEVEDLREEQLKNSNKDLVSKPAEKQVTMFDCAMDDIVPSSAILQTPSTEVDEYAKKLEPLGLSSKQILKVFETLGWNKNDDFELFLLALESFRLQKEMS